MFITFEGPEGCGKSTQSKLLKAYLESLGKQVILTCEPGGTKLGEELRNILLHTPEKLDQLAELALFAADRAEHVAKIIQPALSAGKIVICDRYVDSTVAYQIGGRGLPEDLVRYFNMVSSRGLLPQVTFLLKVDPQIGLQRAGQEKVADRFENEKISFHKAVLNKYLEIAKNDAKRVKIIESNARSIEAVQENIQKELKVLLL
ncbi:MAG: dTMP kinase [Candidatus Margulisiibacteriota bacterium]